MAPTNKVLTHPDREEIIQWLTTGISVRDVETRLNERYPSAEDAHLRIAFSTLQNFRSHHLNLKDKVLEDVREAAQITERIAKNAAIQAEIEKSTAYQDAISNIATEQLEIQREIVKTFTLIESRIKKLFNTVNTGDITDVKLERVLQGYFEQFLKSIEFYKKYVEGYKETQDVNVSVTIMTDQVSLIREAVREVLSELDPAVSVRFMEKITARMRTLDYHHQDYDGMLEGKND